MSNGFWGRPSTPNNWSKTNQLTTTEWSSKGLRPGTAPAVAARAKTGGNNRQAAATTSTQSRPTATESHWQVADHLTSNNVFYQTQTFRGQSRGSLNSRERETGHVSMPSLMDLVDPIEPGKKTSVGGRFRGRSRKKGEKTRRRGDVKYRGTSQQRKKGKKKKKSKKIKLPSTAPAGSTVSKPLITRPVDDVLPNLIVRSPTGAFKNDGDVNTYLNAKRNESETNAPCDDYQEGDYIEEEYFDQELQPTPRQNRGLQPHHHMLNNSYVRGRDGQYMSFHPSHNIGTFNSIVSFKEWGATDSSLYMLAENNASKGGRLLESLDLSGCFSITDYGLSAVLHSATRLKNLNLSACGSQLSDKILILISSVCGNLEKLDISSCRGLTDLGFGAIAGWIDEEEKRGVIRQAKKISVLDGGWNWDDATKNVFGSRPSSREGEASVEEDGKRKVGKVRDVKRASRGLTNLRQLSVVNCPQLSDVSLSRLSIGCPELRTLNVSSCPKVTDDGLREIIDHLKHLRELLMNENVRVSGELFSVSAKSHKDCNLYVCTGLRNVSMKGCYKVNDTRLMSLGQSCALLESINITNCPKVTSNGVKHLCEKCPRLVSLTVIGCGSIGNSVGRAITKNLAGNLMSLDLAGASDLTASSLAPLISQCRNLRHINFSGIPKLSDEVFTGEAEVDRNMEVLRQDPRYADSARQRVRSVYLSDSKFLTKKGFSAIAWLFRYAVVMDLSGCLNFDNTALYHVTEHCRTITELNLNDCDLITDIGVKRISSRCQKLEILRLSVKEDSVGCENVGDKSLGAILHRLRLLRELEFQNRKLTTGNNVPTGPAFRAKTMKNINFSGCTLMKINNLRNIIAECPLLEHMDLTNCRCVVGKSKMNNFKSFINLLSYPELIQVFGTKSFRGFKCVPNYSIRRNQNYFFDRIQLEHDSATKLQVRWREWRQAGFTLMYLIIWTAKLRRKGKVDDNAIVIQKYYRRKIGTRLAWERRKIVSAERIQRCIRSWNEYKKNFVAHLRVHSCIRIQKWWKKYLYMKISLRDRIWECLQNQKRLEEEERRKYEKKYFGARAIQCWYRRIRAVRCLTLLQLKRKNAIFGSALLVPSKRWRRSKVHAPEHDQFIDRTVIRFEGVDQRNHRDQAEEQVGSKKKMKMKNRPSTAPVGTALQPFFAPKIKGKVLPGDVQNIRRYPGRYCQRCKNRHAVVRCSTCLLELCPRCNVELHVINKYGKRAKYHFHPKAKVIDHQMPKDISFVKSVQIAESVWGDTEWVLRPVARVREQRLVMHEELIVEIERREEIREAKRREEERIKKDHQEKCVTIFAAHWRGIVERRKFPKLKELEIVKTANEKNQHIFNSAVKIQQLFRGYSIRIWILVLRMDDSYLFWREVNRRIIKYLPGVTLQQWGIADKLLKEDFVEIITGKNRDFKARFGSKVRKYENDIRRLATKVQNLHCESGEYLKRWATLIDAGKSTPLSNMMEIEAKKLESQGRCLEAKAQGFGSILILMKQRLIFITDRKAYEDRRDAVLRAQKKAFEIAKVNIFKILKLAHETVEAIESMQALPEDDFEAMNIKAESILERAEELERKNQPLPATELEPRISDAEFNELTEQEQHEYETARILQEQEIKTRIEREKKKKAKRMKDRVNVWKAQWSKRNAWLRKEHKHALHKAMKGERTVLAMAKALVETRAEEIRLYKEYDGVQNLLEKSVQAEIHYEAEIMQLECTKQKLEAMNGQGAKGILEAVRKQVILREKQHSLNTNYSARVLQCIKDSDTQTERRERFVVADWSESRNMWAVYARPKRFELEFSSDNWAMDPSEWMDLYKQKPWIDFMKSGKEESDALKKMNETFGGALDEAQREQKVKEDAEAEAKALDDAKKAATAAIIAKQKADIKTITTKYGNVLSNLLTDVSPELLAQREKERRMKMSRLDRFKEDAYNLIMGPTIRRRTEMRRVQESIEQRQKASVGYIEAICGFHITTGAETAKFEAENQQLKLDNKPYFSKIPENIGREWGIYLWVMKTIDQGTMVTAMVLSSAVKYNKLCYVHPEPLIKEGYERSNVLNTEGPDSTQLVVWYKADPMEKLVLHDISVSFTDKEEKFLQEDGYTRLDPDLGDLRMPPDGRIWAKYGGRERDKLAKAQDETYYENKIKGYQQVLQEEPDSFVVKKKIKRLQEDLRQFRINEENKKKNKLRNMVEFLALSEKDMRRLSLHFTDIDLDNSGEIDLTEFFDYLEVDRTVFTDSMFSFLDESNDGTIDFGEFVHACGTICMWEKKEVLQFMFSMYDTAGNGYIVENQLQTLLGAVAGDDPINIPGVERVMMKFDKDGDGRVTWEEFQLAAARFPGAFIPAYRILDQWRKKIMGNKFWKKKKLLFMKVRENMAIQRQEAAKEARRAALELKMKQAADAKEAERERQRLERLEARSPGSGGSPVFGSPVSGKK